MRYSLILFIFSFSVLQAQMGFTQTGKASFYNDRFHGAKTNSGEKYDMNGYTAAHRDLPLNTKIKVTNLKNNKSVTLRINDRGPFHHVRILDVSKAAAKELDMISQGVANVKLEVVELPGDQSAETKPAGTPTSTTKQSKSPVADSIPTAVKTNPEKQTIKTEVDENPTKKVSHDTNTAKSEVTSNLPHVEPIKVDLKDASSEIFRAGYIYNLQGMIQNPKGYGLQVGYFSHIFNTLKYCKILSEQGFTKVFIKADKEPNGTAYRVFIGDFPTEEDANSDIELLREKNREYLIKKYPENKDLP